MSQCRLLPLEEGTINVYESVDLVKAGKSNPVLQASMISDAIRSSMDAINSRFFVAALNLMLEEQAKERVTWEECRD